VAGLWTLLFAPIVARVARRTRFTGPPGDAGLTWTDLLLAVLLGGVVALLCTIWLAPFTSPGTRALGSPDFGEYCWHVGLYITNAMHEWGQNRARLAGLPAGLMAPTVGVVDSLLLSATGSLAVIVGSVYIWGRALHGRAAGIAAAILVGAVGPLAVMGRMVTFYPVVTAGLTLASTGAAVALRWRTWWAIALAGIGAGIALLVDVRGLLWALPAVGLGGLAVLIGPPGRWWGLPIRALALVLPLLLSWELGRWSYNPTSRSLEGSVAIYDELLLEGVPLPPRPARESPHQKFIWGYSDPRFIPETLQHLRNQSAYIPSWYHEQPQVRAGWQRSGAPWVAPVLAALAVAMVGLRRRPVLVIALLGTVFPFLVSMQGAVILKTSNLRFVASAMVFIPVVLGVGFGVLVDGGLSRRGPKVDAPGRPGVLLALGLALLAAILGLPPTWLSPAASWRVPYPLVESAFMTAVKVREGETTTPDAGMRMCVYGMGQVEGDGQLTGALPGGGTPLDGYRRFK